MTGGAATPGTVPAPRPAGPPRTPKHPREEIVESPRIGQLRRELDRGDAGAPERFWREVAAAGTPLVEDVAGDRATVTFLWRDRHGSGDGTERVVLVANRLTDPSVMEDSVLHRVGGTDVWHRSFRLPTTFRATYELAPADGRAPDEGRWTGAAARWHGIVSAIVADPLNPRAFPERDGRLASVVALPGAPPDDWARSRDGVVAGTVSEHRVDSAVLGMSRRVWVHVPARLAAANAGASGVVAAEGAAAVAGSADVGVSGAGAAEDAAAAPAVLVLFDGEEWMGRLDGPALLDNLVAAGRIPPVVTLMVEAISPRDRATDLAPGAPFATFVVDELLPWAHATFGATADPARTFVAGQSLGGLGALSLALEHPDRFAGVVAQSASTWWAPPGDPPRDASAPCWAVERVAAATRAGLRVHLEVGTLEWIMVEDTRRLRDALARAGARVSYAEFAGGHEALCWRAGLADALAGVLSAAA